MNLVCFYDEEPFTVICIFFKLAVKRQIYIWYIIEISLHDLIQYVLVHIYIYIYTFSNMYSI